MADIELVQADITTQHVDAIVNAANSQLFHGGGVALAIARAGGVRFLAASAKAPRVPTGSAAATAPGKLPCHVVVHAVGPVWNGGESDEPRLLASAYQSAVEVAAEHGCKSIAFPSLSTGIYGYPVERAAPVALGAVREALASAPDVELVRFCLFSEQDLGAYRRALGSA